MSYRIQPIRKLKDALHILRYATGSISPILFSVRVATFLIHFFAVETKLQRKLQSSVCLVLIVLMSSLHVKANQVTNLHV